MKKLPYDLEIPFLNIYPSEMKAHVDMKTYMNVHSSISKEVGTIQMPIN